MTGDVRRSLLAGVTVPGGTDPWEALGFTAGDGAVALANGAVVTGATQTGLVVDGPESPGPLEGVPVTAGRVRVATTHANGATDLDHVVLTTDSLERTSAAVEAAWGLPQRRIREVGAVRQAFHRFGDVDGVRGCIVEIVERADAPGTALWGLVVNVWDLDLAVAAADGLLGEPRAAVQPGRRIATVRREAGLPLAVALMSP